MPTRNGSGPAARYDAVIIGGGHNGLVCASYLAAGGLKVGVFERRAVVGGAAVTEEFHPGFRNSTASYTVSLLNPKVIKDLRLAEHGLKIVARPLSNFLPLSEREYLKVGGWSRSVAGWHVERRGRRSIPLPERRQRGTAPLRSRSFRRRQSRSRSRRR